MIKHLQIISLFILLINTSWAQKTPENKSGIEGGVEFRVLKKVNKFLLLGEIQRREELFGVDYQQLMLGSYYRFTKRWRMGLFFQGEQGLRWDSDWIQQPVWGWRDIESRWDYSTVIDSTFSDRLSENMLWEIKGRLQYYHSRDALLFKLRPGLRYFFMKNGLPWWQLFTQVEGYFPVNYGEEPLYEYWVYLGSLYQMTQNFSIGPVASYRTRWFHSYEGFEDKTAENYRTRFSTVYFGFNAVYVW